MRNEMTPDEIPKEELIDLQCVKCRQAWRVGWWRAKAMTFICDECRATEVRDAQR